MGDESVGGGDSRGIVRGGNPGGNVRTHACGLAMFVFDSHSQAVSASKLSLDNRMPRYDPTGISKPSRPIRTADRLYCG